MAQMSLYRYIIDQLMAQSGVADLACEGWVCQTDDGVLNSKGPLFPTQPSVLVEINKVKLVAASQKKRQGSYKSYLSFTPEEKAPTQ